MVAIFAALTKGGGPSAEKARSAGAEPTRLASRSDLRPPKIVVSKRSSKVAPGLIFIAPKKVFGAKKVPGAQQGPMIIDDSGRVRWFHPLPKGQTAYDFRTQEYEGKPVLTWWQGRALYGSGRGQGIIYDQQYRPVAQVRPPSGVRADIHEFQLTDRGTALMIEYRPKIADLRSIGGPKRGKVNDGIVWEIDVKTGKVVFEWHSLDHVKVTESYEPLSKKYGPNWDYMHLNSVEEDPDGNLLVSARHTWAVYNIDRETGKVRWRLGGKRSDFKLGKGVRFAWQHDARSLSRDRITIFDNAAASEPYRPRSRQITVSLNRKAKRATLVRSIEHPKGLSAGTQANGQTLPGGHTFVGWGSRGYFSEFAAGKRPLFDARVPKGYDTYRAFRLPWTGQPKTVPRAAISVSGGVVRARASWNGATKVARWQIVAGPDRTSLRPVGNSVRWGGLETALSARTSASHAAVRGLDASGRVLATSAVRKVR
jgi:hypothetical protein